MHFSGARLSAFAVADAMARVTRQQQQQQQQPHLGPRALASGTDGATAHAAYMVPSLRALAERRAMAAGDGDGTQMSVAGLQALLASRLALEAARTALLPAGQPPSAHVDDPLAAAGAASPAVEKEEKTAAAAAVDAEAAALLAEAVALYNPTLDAAIVARAAAAVDLPQASRLARRLRSVLAQVGPTRFTRSVFPQWRRQVQQQHQQQQQAEEAAAGIVGRLATASEKGAGRQQRLRAFVRYPSDLQVNEVLPNGRIVTLTQPTLLPDGTPIPKELSASLKASLAGGGNVAFLHFVLYRERASLDDAYRLLAAAAADVGVDPAAFAVNAPLDGAMTAVQTCSVRVAAPSSGLDPLAAREWCRRLMRRLVRVNAGDAAGGARVRVQLLEWRRFPCTAAVGALCRAQHALMLRGLSRRGGHLEATALAAGRCAPNFFGRGLCGPPGCPLRYYDAAAAADAGEFADAEFILACLALWEAAGAAAAAPGWVAEALRALAGDEERPGAWRQHYRATVPQAVQHRASEAKAALLWNVVVSCRARRVGGGAVTSATPEAGDFVLLPEADDNTNDDNTSTAAEAETETDTTSNIGGRAGRRRRDRPRRPAPAVVVKPELLPAASASTAVAEVHRHRSASTAAAVATVVPLLTDDEAAPFSLMDAVAPVDCDGACEELRRLARSLGFPAASAAGDGGARPSQRPPHFRPLFVAASGFPRAAALWAKEFTEPTDAFAGGEAAAAAYALATDLALAHAAGRHRDFAAQSRGRQQEVWAIGRRGRAIADRLPPGLLASTALSLAGPAPRQNAASKCLVLHFTLPAESYSGSFLREFVLIENRCPPPAPLHAPNAATGGAAAEAETTAPSAGDGERQDTLATLADTADDGPEWQEGNLLALQPARGRRQ